MFFKLFSSQPIFHRQNFSRPLKNDFHLESISDSTIFPQKSRCSLKKKVFTSILSPISLFFSQNQGVLQKKKKKGLHFDFISDFTVFLPKSRCSLKKKKKGLHFNLLLHFAFFLPIPQPPV